MSGTTPVAFRVLRCSSSRFLSHAIGKRPRRRCGSSTKTFAKDELKDVKPLAVWGFGNGVLFTKDVVIKTPADAKGLKLRASNRQTNDAFALIGAQPQSIPPPGVPEALAKGVVDGVVFPYDAVIPFKLDELTNRVSEFGGDRTFYNTVLLFVMNKAKYDGLPDDLKKVIDANSGAALSRDLGRKWDESDNIGRAAVLKRNTPIHVIDGADLAAWRKATEPIYCQVDRRTQQGRRQGRRARQDRAGPGGEVLQVNDARRPDIDRAAPEPHGPLGRALERVCEGVAMLGGLLLVAIMLVSSVSVIGRGLSQLFGAKLSGIPGDIEIVQLGCAVAVFAFLPLCQLKRANVLVGAFTKNLPVRYRSMFDLAANLLFLVLSFALALQLGHGTVEKFATTTPPWCCAFRRAGRTPWRWRSLGCS